MRRRYSESELDNKKEACKKRISPNGTRLPDPISEGTICTDIAGKKWRVGRSAGVGGFGEIYLVSDDTSRPVGGDARHVIKVEPHHSGPLFVERNFYVRVAKQDMIDEWKLTRNLTHLGISPYVASGSLTYRGKLYRFLVLERFGSDLSKLFLNSGRRFHLKTTLYIALQILDTLEYIHDKGYCHADIKDSNILLGHRKSTENQVYLLDYGLASMLYNEHGKHKEYGPDERRAHAGTIEFVNRDGHQGACSRRGDLETLGYNLLQWLCGRLPWTDDTSPAKPDYVYLQKKWFMSNISTWVKRCYHDAEPPGALIQYLKYVAGLSFESKPNYAYCKMIFRQGIKDACFVDDGKLVFGVSPAVKTTKKLCGKRKILEEPENLENGIPHKMSKASRNLNIFRKPCVPHNINRMTRNSPGSQVLLRSQHFSWTKVLSGDPEKILFAEKKVRKVAHVQKLELPGTIVPNSKLASRVRERMMPTPKDEVKVDKGLDNLPHFAVYTPAMLRVIMRKKLVKMVAVPAARKQRSDSSYSSSSDVPACFQGYNYAMMEVAQSMQRRKQSEVEEQLACSRRVYKSSPRARADSVANDSRSNSVAVSQKNNVVRTPEKKTMVRFPEKKTMVRSPEKKTMVRSPEKKTAVRSPEKNNVVRTLEKKNVVRTPEKKTVVRMPEKKTSVKTSGKKTVNRPSRNKVVDRSFCEVTVRLYARETVSRSSGSETVSRSSVREIMHKSSGKETTDGSSGKETLCKSSVKVTVSRLHEEKTVSKKSRKNAAVKSQGRKVVARMQACVALRTSARAAKMRALKLAQQKAQARLKSTATRLLRSNYFESPELSESHVMSDENSAM